MKYELYNLYKIPPVQLTSQVSQGSALSLRMQFQGPGGQDCQSPDLWSEEVLTVDLCNIEEILLEGSHFTGEFLLEFTQKGRLVCFLSLGGGG